MAYPVFVYTLYIPLCARQSPSVNRPKCRKLFSEITSHVRLRIDEISPARKGIIIRYANLQMYTVTLFDEMRTISHSHSAVIIIIYNKILLYSPRGCTNDLSQRTWIFLRIIVSWYIRVDVDFDAPCIIRARIKSSVSWNIHEKHHNLIWIKQLIHAEIIIN